MIPIHNPLALAHLVAWAAGALLVCFRLGRQRYAWTVSAALGAAFFSALRVYQVSLNGVPVNPVIREFSASAQSALLTLLLTVMVAQALSVRVWFRFFLFLAAANSIALCAHAAYITFTSAFAPVRFLGAADREPWGILLNASMSGCFNAAIYPLVETRRRAFRGLVLAALIAAGRSLPVAVLFAGLGARLLIERRHRILVLLAPASLLAGYLIKGPHLFTTRGRDLIWGRAWAFYRDHLNWAIGSGLGGFYVIGPALTGREQGIAFVWLHSDWYQILFELGWIGFVAVVVMYAHALWRARANPTVFSALVAYAAFGAANMPLRYPLSGLLGAVLIRWALERPLEGARPQEAVVGGVECRIASAPSFV